MTSIAPTDVDIITESSLTTLSDLTPTDPGDEPPGQRHALKPDVIGATQCLRMWLIIDRKKLGKWVGKGNWTEHSTPSHLSAEGDD